jgi:hypothetical protein
MRLPHLTAIVPRSVVIPYNNTYLINHEIAAEQNELIHENIAKSKAQPSGESQTRGSSCGSGRDKPGDGNEWAAAAVPVNTKTHKTIIALTWLVAISGMFSRLGYHCA